MSRDWGRVLKHRHYLTWNCTSCWRIVLAKKPDKVPKIRLYISNTFNQVNWCFFIIIINDSLYTRDLWIPWISLTFLFYEDVVGRPERSSSSTSFLSLPNRLCNSKTRARDMHSFPELNYMGVECFTTLSYDE